MTVVPTLDSLPLLFRAANLIQDSFLITTADVEVPGPQIVYVNRSFTEMTGHSGADVIGKSPRFLQGEETSPEELSRLRKHLQLGLDYDGQLVNYRKDGSRFVVGLRIRPIRDGSGNVTHFFALQRDVTKESEEQTRLESLEQAVQQTQDSILMFGTDGRVHWANHAYLAWSGLDLEQVLDALIWSLPGAPQVREEFSWARRQLSSGRSWQREYEVKSPGDGGGRGRRTVATAISPVRLGDDEPAEFVVISRDVTERNRLFHIEGAHRHADQMSQIFATIRHELGNPVNSVKSALTVLDSEEDPLSPRQSQYVSRILDEVARLEFLLVSLRSFGLFDRLQIERVEARRLMGRLQLSMASKMEQRGIEFRISRPPEGLHLAVDEQGLLHVLEQLLDNAMDAVDGVESPEIRLEGLVAGHRLCLMICDNGIGMSKQDLEKAKRPFFTTKEKAAGLGLPSVSKLLSKMRGTLAIESTRVTEAASSGTVSSKTSSGTSSGTTVSIELDLAEAP